MARTNNLTNFLNDVATAIKQKLGDNTPIPASQFDAKIGEIETGGNYQTKSISITTNGNYTQLPDTGYDAMDQVSITVNVPTGGSGDVKLFETEQAMQADPNPSEGDLAVVYRNDSAPIVEDMTVTRCHCLSTVTLSDTVTSTKTWRDNNHKIDIRITASSATITYYLSEGDSEKVTYTSSDGIHYTTTSTTLQFNESITFSSSRYTWLPEISNFILAGGMTFDGLYEYTVGLIDDTKLYWCNVADCTITWNETRNQITRFVVNAKTDNYIDGNVLKQLIPDIQALYSATISNVTFFFNTSDELCFVMTSGGSNEYTLAYNKTSGNLPVGIGLGVGSSGSEATLYKVNSSLTSFTKIRDISPVKPGSWGYTPLADIKTIPITVNITGKVTFPTNVSTPGNFSTTITNPIDCKSYYNYYLRASTQFTLSSPNQLLPDMIAYGENGTVIGDGSIYGNLDWNDILSGFNLIPSVNHSILPASSNTNAITSYNHNKLTYDTVARYVASNPINISALKQYGCTSMAKISNNKYFMYNNSNATYNIVEDNDKVYTITACTNNTGVGGTIMYTTFDDTNNYVYCLVSYNSMLYIQKVDVANTEVTTVTSISDSSNKRGMISVQNQAAYIGSRNGFYKLSFSGTKTTIQSGGWSSAISVSKQYMIVYRSSGTEIYDILNERWTGLKTTTQSADALFTIGTKTYWFTNGSNEVKIIENGVVTSTVTTTKNAQLGNTTNLYSYYEIPLNYNGYTPLQGFVITNTGDVKAIATDILPYILYMVDEADIVFNDRFSTYYVTGVDVKTDGSGQYIAFKPQSTTLIRDSEHNYILQHNTLP